MERKIVDLQNKSNWNIGNCNDVIILKFNDITRNLVEYGIFDIDDDLGTSLCNYKDLLKAMFYCDMLISPKFSCLKINNDSSVLMQNDNKDIISVSDNIIGNIIGNIGNYEMIDYDDSMQEMEITNILCDDTKVWIMGTLSNNLEIIEVDINGSIGFVNNSLSDFDSIEEFTKFYHNVISEKETIDELDTNKLLLRFSSTNFEDVVKYCPLSKLEEMQKYINSEIEKRNGL